jgi:hypothetical protein
MLFLYSFVLLNVKIKLIEKFKSGFLIPKSQLKIH